MVMMLPMHESPRPSIAPPTTPAGEVPIDAPMLLVTYLRDRDVHCPRCDYNLRNATHAVCPECAEPLRLTVSLERPILGAFLTTIAPPLGCGVCGLIFAMLITLRPGAPPPILLWTAMALFSGVAGVVVIMRRHAFFRMSRERQRTWALGSCAVHALMVIVLVMAMFMS
jgi:hypothetical protein